MPDLERLAPAADEKLRVLGHRSLVHAEDAELADVGVDDDLEDMRQHVLLRVRFRAELLDRLAVDDLALEEERRVAFGRIRQQSLEHLHEFIDAGAILRGDEAHRDQVALAQRLLERRMQLLGLDRLALLEVLGHQFFIDLDDLVDQRLVRFGDRREVGLAVGVEEAVDDFRAATGRQVDRQDFLAECRAQVREYLWQIDVLGVDLVDDQQATQLAAPGPVHHARGDHLDAALRIDDDRGGFHRIERADRLADEVRKPGRVEQVHTRRRKIQVQHRGAQRVQEGLLQAVEVTDRRPLFDTACRGDRARAREQRFGECCLACTAVAQQGHGPQVLR